VFRRKVGAFDASLKGIKVGVRFTLAEDNAHDLPALLQRIEEEGIDKFYLSHLNYTARGNTNRGGDAFLQTTRTTMDLLFDTCWKHITNGTDKEFVTGNNDADEVHLRHWVQRHFPEHEAALRAKLSQWGDNSSGVNVANIDNLGNVRNSTFFSIWPESRAPHHQGPLRRLHLFRCVRRQHPGARTATHPRGVAWQEDPACYRSDEEIGVTGERERVPMKPNIGIRQDREAAAHSDSTVVGSADWQTSANALNENLDSATDCIAIYAIG
jgi:MoaA/NifB/PqqE/SkfB family radical SAM enzyme